MRQTLVLPSDEAQICFLKTGIYIFCFSSVSQAKDPNTQRLWNAYILDISVFKIPDFHKAPFSGLAIGAISSIPL